MISLWEQGLNSRKAIYQAYKKVVIYKHLASQLIPSNSIKHSIKMINFNLLWMKNFNHH